MILLYIDNVHHWMLHHEDNTYCHFSHILFLYRRGTLGHWETTGINLKEGSRKGEYLITSQRLAKG